MPKFQYSLRNSCVTMKTFPKRFLSSWQKYTRQQTILSEDEHMLQRTVQKYAATILQPRIVNAFRTSTFDRRIASEIGSLGLFAPQLDGYGCAGASEFSYGIVAYELEKVDSAYRSTFSVQSSLVILPIYTFGTEEQKKYFLPKLTSGDWLGCFGLTEPDAGSDPSNMRTVAIPQKDGSFHLSGSKTWITHAPDADVFIIWAKRSDSGELCGFILERGMLGLSTTSIGGKLSLRASSTGSIFMDNVSVGVHRMLQVSGFKGPFTCLNSARLGISFGVLGAAEQCIQTALEYTITRTQFKRPLAHTQLVQLTLADMYTEWSLAYSSSFQAFRWKEHNNGTLDAHTISFLKRNACQKSLRIARQSRDLLGGNGISDEYPCFRHALNLEAVNTYEGTSFIHGLIMGRSMTGLSAF